MNNTAWSSSPVRNPDSQSGNASSNLVQAICPYCKTPLALPDDEVILTGNRPLSEGDFVVCLECREIVRFDFQLQPRSLNERTLLDLMGQKELFIALLRYRLQLLIESRREKHEFNDSSDGIPGIWEIYSRSRA